MRPIKRVKSEIFVSVAERNDHDATLDGVGPRSLSRCVFLLDGPVDDAAAGKQRDGYVHSRRVLLNEPDFG